MRPSFAFRALSLAIGLSAFSLSGHAAIQFTCSDALTSEAGESLVMRCSGVLDVRGDGANDPGSVLSNAVGISLHGELGLSLDRLMLVSPNIVLTVGQGPLQLGDELVVTASGGDVHIGVPPRVQLGQGDTRQDAVLRPVAGGTVSVNGAGSGNLVFSPDVAPTQGIGQQGGSIAVGGGILVTEDNSPLLVPQVGQVPEPGTWALVLGGLGAWGALALTARRERADQPTMGG